jgi:hypothetical protein
MRKDDQMLDEVAKVALADATHVDGYFRLWGKVMTDRLEATPMDDLPCGHPWVDGQRRWVDGQPTEDIVCRVCAP